MSAALAVRAQRAVYNFFEYTKGHTGNPPSVAEYALTYPEGQHLKVIRVRVSKCLRQKQDNLD